MPAELPMATEALPVITQPSSAPAVQVPRETSQIVPPAVPTMPAAVPIMQLAMSEPAVPTMPAAVPTVQLAVPEPIGKVS